MALFKLCPRPKKSSWHYCIVDKSSSEQNICDSTFISFIVRPIIVAQVCLTAGRQTGNQTDKRICMHVNFKIIKIIKFSVAKIHRMYQCRIKYLILCFFNQDTESCVSSQESRVAHKCYLQEPLTLHFNPWYLYNHWADFY